MCFFPLFFIYRFHLPFIQLTVKIQIRIQQTELAVHCYVYLFVWSASDEHLHYLNTIRASYKYSITNANTNVYISIDCAPFLRSQWTQICHFICFGMYIYVISSWFLLISFSSLTFIFLFFFIAMARPEYQEEFPQSILFIVSIMFQEKMKWIKSNVYFRSQMRINWNTCIESGKHSIANET